MVIPSEGKTSRRELNSSFFGRVRNRFLWQSRASQKSIVMTIPELFTRKRTDCFLADLKWFFDWLADDSVEKIRENFQWQFQIIHLTTIPDVSFSAIAMESVMAMYYEHTLKSRLSSATVTVISDNVYTGSGIVTGDANISKMVDSFMTANKDLIPAIITKNNTHTEVSVKY